MQNFRSLAAFERPAAAYLPFVLLFGLQLTKVEQLNTPGLDHGVLYYQAIASYKRQCKLEARQSDDRFPIALACVFAYAFMQ